MDQKVQSLFGSGFTAEELDLTSDLLPIAEYVEDRSKMIDQMLSSIRVPLLRSLLPSYLRDTPIDELKEILLHELSSIPRKDVLEVLSDGSCYVPFCEAVKQLELSVTRKLEIVPSKPLLKEAPRPVPPPLSTEPIFSDQEEPQTSTMSSKDKEAIFPDAFPDETMFSEDITIDASLEQAPDMYDDTAVYGDIDSKPEINEDDSIADNFERRNVEGRVFRGRLGNEDEVLEEEEPEEAAEDTLEEATEMRKCKKNKRKKSRKKRKETYSSSPSPVRAAVEPEPEPKVEPEPEMNPGSEEGELETDEELESLVELRQREEAERIRREKQLEMMRRIAPDEYYRLKTAMEPSSDEDARSVSSTENDVSMPWNRPEYGRSERTLSRREPLVHRPVNPIELTNPVPDHPAYQFTAAFRMQSQVKEEVKEDSSSYLRAVKDSLNVLESDVRKAEVESMHNLTSARVSDLISDVSDVERLFSVTTEKANVSENELVTLRKRIDACSSAISLLDQFVRSSKASVIGDTD
ncbi:unnamed protein product [Notodromas monacha]|uniref:Uncharacterized protein n=1 Tax=Notodromas monacha TaxID=399045 RepID=A0A7R9BIH2_9CRUS|nr:unnamed protein product [Notodromas monacha]CAG0914547.1 unnamed protein product [Notodromas monacha]